MAPKLTITYGVRFERYPAPYRDHTGISEVYVDRPQTSNVEVGGVMGNPKSAGVDMGWGFFAPRVGFAYRLNDKTVIRTGAGMTVDPDNVRELRDEYPFDVQANYSASNGFGTIAIDPATGSGDAPHLRHPDSSRTQLHLGLFGAASKPRHQRLVAEFPPRLHRKLEPVCAARSGHGLRGQRGLCRRSVRPPADQRQSV